MDRREAARLRRAIMGSMIEIAALAGELPDANERAAFMERFAELRARNADHHSMWPIALVDLTDPTYASSIGRVRKEYLRFFRFID